MLVKNISLVSNTKVRFFQKTTQIIKIIILKIFGTHFVILKISYIFIFIANENAAQ
jgi:hypothetical protein